uniref:Uncharacterized protein n=1 Tax=Alphatorquevirus sp. TaxID=2809145 RepID=A0A8K1XYP2_9VIRU|nr:MAG: hypothetical protein [Alphatorquevirus sp.]
MFAPEKRTPTKGDWETEYQACKAFDRPPRTDLSRPPCYPWMPPTFNVSFKLNFK